MNASVEELRATFDNVLVRLRREERKPLGEVIGMALPLGIGAKAPKRMMVFPLGEPPSNDDRKWKFTKADLQRTVADFNTRTEPLPIFYEHGGGPRGKIAAGWIDSVDLAPDGLYASIRWTDTAQKEIESGEWAFRSPAWNGEEDSLGFIYAGPLSHIGLVNDPAIGGLAPNIASQSVASSQPLTQPEQRIEEPQPTPLVKEQSMSVVEAAKKTAAMDKKGILDAIKAAFPGSDVFGDDVLAGLVSDALSGMPAADPMMPDGSAKPETPAVPLAPFASAEDVAKHVEAATAAATEEMKKETESLKARVKELEAHELSGKIINASAADRKSDPPKNFAERIREKRAAGMRS